MNIGDVLSLFDGMSCGRLALMDAGVNFGTYYASEIDKHAVFQSSSMFPDTVHLGDVTRWREWKIDWAKIGLIIAGSPCQGFSRAGKQLNFDDPRSMLFFVFVDIYKHIKILNPTVRFLLENVDMERRCLGVISQHLGVLPVNINSNLVSAQNRNRWYWTNIKTRHDGIFGDLVTDIPQPEDKKIHLKDILQPEDEVGEKYYVSYKHAEHVTDEQRLKKNYTRMCNEHDKGIALMANDFKSWAGNYVFVPNSKYSTSRIRRLTTLEAQRLQTVPEWYKWSPIPDSQIYRMLGNGWTIKVISHIFKHIN